MASTADTWVSKYPTDLVLNSVSDTTVTMSLLHYDDEARAVVMSVSTGSPLDCMAST